MAGNSIGLGLAELQQVCRLVSSKPSVNFMGWRADARSLASQCDQYWCGGDGVAWDQAALEAMADGLPVIVADTPQHRQLIQPGVNGYLVSIGRSAMIARISNQLRLTPDLGQEVGEAGRRGVLEAFPLDRFLDEYRRCYVECGGHRRTTRLRLSQVAM